MYTAKVIKTIDNEPGSWQSTLIGVFNDSDIKVGEFIRNYPSMGVSTFAPFKRENKWYALYSENYTEIALMELPSCKKIEVIGGQSHSFCPVEIWVPKYRQYKFVYKRDGIEYKNFYRIYDNTDFNNCSKEDGKHELEDYETFALVSGCSWGDDSSWKVVAVDLSDLKNINLVTPWGYCELAMCANLKNIDIDWDFSPEHDSKAVYSFEIPTKSVFYWMGGVTDKMYEKYDSSTKIDNLSTETKS